MDVKAVGQMGTSIVVETDDGRMAEIRQDGTLGAITDSEHFMRNLGGYIQPVTDEAAANEAVDAAPGLLPPPFEGTVEVPK